MDLSGRNSGFSGTASQVSECGKRSRYQRRALPQIHISGCPSSCGTHQTGEIGFHGCVKVIDKVPHPAFTLHLNGCDLQGKERMGEKVGVIIEEDIPKFLVKLGKVVEETGMDYKQWNETYPDRIKELAEEFVK